MEKEGCNRSPKITERNKGRKTGIRSNGRRGTRTEQQLKTRCGHSSCADPAWQGGPQWNGVERIEGVGID